MAFFDYPGVGRIRGAAAAPDVHAGEKLAVVPVGALSSEFTVGISTLAPL